MKKLLISVDDKFFRSDAILHGRVIRKFFETMTENVFNLSYLYWKEYQELVGSGDLPLLYKERNLYSIFASAINEITPIHLSEWSFNKADTSANKNRRVDFWCLNKNQDNGKRINYFIEIKKTYYCLSEGTKESFTEHAKSTINELSEQLIELKKMRPNWEGEGSVFLGISVIHGYHSSKKDVVFDESHIRDNIYNQIDGRSGSQLLMSTWTLPDSMDVQWEKDKCKFISIAGIAITKSRV